MRNTAKRHLGQPGVSACYHRINPETVAGDRLVPPPALIGRACPDEALRAILGCGDSVAVADSPYHLHVGRPTGSLLRWPDVASAVSAGPPPSRPGT